MHPVSLRVVHTQKVRAVAYYVRCEKPVIWMTRLELFAIRQLAKVVRKMTNALIRDILAASSAFPR